MKLYLLSDENGYQWIVVGIYTSRDLAENKRNEILESYSYDASEYYKVHEVETDKEIEFLGLII